jgi:hypothetical protein
MAVRMREQLRRDAITGSTRGLVGREQLAQWLGLAARVRDHIRVVDSVQEVTRSLGALLLELRLLLFERPEPCEQLLATAALARIEPLALGAVCTALLIEHVAIELIVAATGVPRCSGATCAHAGRLDRFDIFLECADPLAGRAAAVLAAALVRDLRLGFTDRLALHRRCLDLLTLLVSAGNARLVAEDVAVRMECGKEEALQALQEMVRLGYLDAGPASYVFSSPTGVLFHRAEIQPSPR